MSNPWSTIVGSVPATVTAILTDLGPVLALMIGLAVAAFIVAVVVRAFTGG